MSLSKKNKILIILTAVGFGLLFAIMILGTIFPGEPSPIFVSWYVLAAVGEVIAFMIAILITCLIVRKKDKELKEQYEQHQAVSLGSPLSLSICRYCIAEVKEKEFSETNEIIAGKQQSKVRNQGKHVVTPKSSFLCKMYRKKPKTSQKWLVFG